MRPPSESIAWSGPTPVGPAAAGPTSGPERFAAAGPRGWLERSPPFTLSLTLHVVGLLVLALIVIRQPRQQRTRLELVFGPGAGLGQPAEGVAIQPANEADDESESPATNSEEPAVEPPSQTGTTEMPEDAANTSAEAPTEGSQSPATVATESVAATGPAAVRLTVSGRSADRRDALVAEGGGGEDTEAAVGLALEWLVRNQEKTGLWSLRGPYADGSRQENRLAATAMALLALQGAGHTTDAGSHADAVRRAWKALLARQLPDGTFDVGTIPEQHAMYAHAQVTIALCEALAMTRDPAFEKPAASAVSYAVAAQMPDGGWRYHPPDPAPSSALTNKGDMSVTGWFVMALKSSEMAGLEIPQTVSTRLTDFLDASFVSDAKGYDYQIQPQQRFFKERPAMTAEALLARLYLGWPADDVRIQAGIDLLFHVLPFEDCPLDQRIGVERCTGRWGPQGIDAFSADAADKPRLNKHPEVYAWYYTTQVCRHVQGEPWRRWNQWMRATLPPNQAATGKERGSWSPAWDQWGQHGGRLFMTCLCTCMLEAYYRHVPLHGQP